MIKIRSGLAYPDAVCELFEEYTQMLVANDPAFQTYLDAQNYEAEREHLDEKYDAPDGALLLATVDGDVAGCVALRRLDAKRCEMKRLYVRPAFQKRHLGRRLVEEIVSQAKTMGYESMWLDTLPFLQGALHLYERCGFEPASRYNDSPLDTSIFLWMDLKKENKGETNMKVEMKLKEMGIELPEMAAPKGSYIPVSRTGNLLFLSGQLPTQNNALIYEGHVGSDVTLEQAQEAARLCMINALAAIKATIGDLDQIKKIVKVQSFVNSAPGFVSQHVVTNGASDFLGEALGEKGKHARTAVAVPELPLGSPIEIEMIVEVE